MKECKYFDPEMILIKDMISFLYDTLEERSGGLCHIVTDDNNIDDESLKFVIDYASNEEFKNRKDRNVSIYICQSMLKLSMTQREFLFGLLDSDEDLIDILQNTGCLYKVCDGKHCPYKDELNRFHAESKCISQYGDNILFCAGDYPIEEVE